MDMDTPASPQSMSTPLPHTPETLPRGGRDYSSTSVQHDTGHLLQLTDRLMQELRNAKASMKNIKRRLKEINALDDSQSKSDALRDYVNRGISQLGISKQPPPPVSNDVDMAFMSGMNRLVSEWHQVSLQAREQAIFMIL